MQIGKRRRTEKRKTVEHTMHASTLTMKTKRYHGTILTLAIALRAAVALQSSAATIYVPGPSTNASPLRFKAIGAGEWHSLAVQSNGTVQAWGYNGQGQAVVPSGLSGVIAVAGGDEHSLALKSDGTVVAW